MKQYLLFFLLFFTTQLNAAHIVGGEMSYSIVSHQTNTNRYRFKMRVYRDAFTTLGAQLDAVAAINIYRQNLVAQSFSTPIISQAMVALPQIRWLTIPPNVAVEVGLYEWELDLPIINDTYTVAYQRCCRNATVQNIVSPSNVGATYSVEITPEAQRLGNNSPVFSAYPPILICAQEPINVLQNAVDPDGDRLVYRLCSALNGASQAAPTQSSPPPFTVIPYRSPTYSATQPMTGTPPLSIDSVTGRLIGRPDMIGQFIVTVCVEEYRNGQLLGKIYRDFQFNVVSCQNLPPGNLAAPTLLTPANQAVLPAYNNLQMTWTSVPNATSYLFEISQSSDFGDAFQFETTTPNILLTNTRLLGFLKANNTYYWRAKAFRNNETSSDYSSTFSFKTGILNKSVEVQGLNDFTIQPNPLSNSAYFSVKITADKALNTVIKLTNMAGQELARQNCAFDIGSNEQAIFVGKLPNGVYSVGIETDEGVVRKKLIVQN